MNLTRTLDENEGIMKGGPLEGKYRFSELHFHWGENDHIGSEHTVNGFSAPLELHIVFQKESTMELAVAGFFFNISVSKKLYLCILLNDLDVLSKFMHLLLSKFKHFKIRIENPIQSCLIF